MLAFVDLAPPADATGVQVLSDLPAVPGTAYCGFFVRCDKDGQLRTTLDWYAAILEERPFVPLGVVCQPQLCFSALGGFPHAVCPVLSTSQLIGESPPLASIEQLRAASIEGAVISMIVREFGPDVLAKKRTVKALVARAIDGGQLQSVARDLNLSPQTIRNRLAKVGLKPGYLMRIARVWAYQMRVRMGVDRHTALMATGWNNPEARRKVIRRLRMVQRLPRKL